MYSYGSDRIFFKAVNKGRRPIYLRKVDGDLMKNGWAGSPVETSEFGKKLEEGQCIERTWHIKDVYVEGPDFEDEYKNIWFEDSLGKRHKIPRSEKYLKRLKGTARAT